ncbi:amino acid ABC transporter permease [Elioraea sp.]|uniref:amino acid ABC transporter permease n=1 Tax=Elioraea sp. TaxID=2185103 RepID=UPI0025BA1CA7|nr:amino acid ABC transporter permease [Elioraea sp.]
MAPAFDFGAVLVDWRMLLLGVAWTIGLTIVAAVFGLVIGIAGGWVRAEGPRPFRLAVGAYVELIRNTPFIVQLFFIFFGLPAAGVRLSAETAAMLAMVINLGAYATEIVRAGIEATPRGQIEAAMSLALSRAQTFRHIILPPGLRKVWPALVSQIVIVMLGSAVCGQISVEELSFAANLIQSRNFRSFEAYFIVTLVYLVLAILLRQALNWIGPRFIFGGAA